MRTTVTLDADTEALVRRHMRERGVSFKQAINDALRDGLTRQTKRGSFATPSAKLGVPAVNLDRALRVAGELEDDDLIRKARAGK